MPTTKIATLETFAAALGNVTAAQLDNAQKALRGVAAESSLSAFLKTGNKQFASTAAYAAVFKGILAVFADGQKTPLLGFAVASKRESPTLALLVSMGILSESGQVLIGVVEGGKKWATDNADKQAAFVALCHAAATTAADKARAKRESDAITKKLSEPAVIEESAPVAAPLTPGQQDNADTARVIARIQSGELSADNIAALLAVLAPHGVKAAPKVKAKVTA